VKFGKIWQIGSKYFPLFGVRFSGKSIRPVLLQRQRQIFKNRKKTVCSNPTFFVFKIHIPQNAMCCEKFWKISPKEIQENHK